MSNAIIIGWSLFNSSINTEHFKFIDKKIKGFVADGILDNQKYVVGQKIIEEQYRGLGLVEISTKILDSNCFEKYHYYIATAKKDNLVSNRFLEKSFYKLFFEDNERRYFFKRIEQTKSQIECSTIKFKNGFKFSIRMAILDDVEALGKLNYKYHISNVKSKDKGYLTSLYSKEDFKKIIEKNEICVIEIFRQ